VGSPPKREDDLAVVALERRLEHNGRMTLRSHGLSRIASALFAVVALASLVPLACSGFPFPPGYVAGPVNGVPATCNGDAYLAVPSGDCPNSQCDSPVAFAVCDGNTFTGCTCTQPPGVLIAALDVEAGNGFEDEGFACGPEGCFSDASEDPCNPDDASGGDCTEPIDAPLYDVGDRGECSGQEAQKICGAECGPCTGYAYLLCDGLFFSACSCDLPTGYTLNDAGVQGCGGPKDAGKKDAEHDAAKDASKDVEKDVSKDVAKEATVDATKDVGPD
jgi:hypothetical protein